MRKVTGFLGGLLVALVVSSNGGPALAHGDEAEEAETSDGGHALEHMEEIHREHEHEHDFEAMEEMSPEKIDRVMRLMREVGLVVPPMDPARGRTLFLEKGCVVCHSVNGVGGDVGPSLNASEMPSPMNAFEFAARMWRGAPAMVQMQEALFGEIIQLNGQELADIIGFAHDEAEQARLTADQIPEQYKSQIMK